MNPLRRFAPRPPFAPQKGEVPPYPRRGGGISRSVVCSLGLALRRGGRSWLAGVEGGGLVGGGLGGLGVGAGCD